MNKKKIRDDIKTAKTFLTKEEIEEQSNVIFHKLEKYLSLDDYDAIYTYVAFNEEVQTNKVIDYGFRNNIKVAVPRIDNKKMDFYYINQMEDLTCGFYGILEPKTTNKAMDHHILMIVPGLAFDEEYNRIGYGAGYYDKYFKEHKHLSIKKIALAYDFQIVKQIETTPYDEKIDGIITPTRLFYKKER